MKLSRELWKKALLINERYIQENGRSIPRRDLAKLLDVSEQLARQILFAINNKDIIVHKPEVMTFEDKTVLVMADLHIPYEDKLAIETMFNYIEQNKILINTVVILGDLIDFYKVSYFSKDPRKFNINIEIMQAKKFLTNLRNIFPDAEILYKTGNHDGVRLERYIFDKAPELTEILEGLLQYKLELDKLRISYIEEPFQIGKLWYLHGHELGRGSYNPEYITNVVWRKVYDNFIVGHWHRRQDKIYKDINGNTYIGAVVGALCQLEVDYQPINNWTHGFAIVRYDKNGNFRIDNKTIYDGNVF